MVVMVCGEVGGLCCCYEVLLLCVDVGEIIDRGDEVQWNDGMC